MKIPKLPKDNAWMEILVSYPFFGNHELPSNHRLFWDYSFMDDIASTQFAKATKENFEQVNSAKDNWTGQTFRDYLSLQSKDHTFIAFDESDETIPLNEDIISFYFSKPTKESITEFLQEFRERCLKAAREASGDDEFFDYMPGFIHIFYQLCLFFHEDNLYNSMIEQLLSEERDTEYEFYSTKITR